MKPTRFLLTAVAFLLIATTGNATEIEGDVWGIWAPENNPYLVVGEIRVPAESTLVIEPGVAVTFKGYYKFIVDSNATLQAIGTETDSIYFTTDDTATGWHGIRFLQSHPNSQMSYCRIEYGKAIGASPDSCGGGIFCLASDITVSHCYLASNFSEGDGAAIYCNSCVTLSITDNVIVENLAQNGHGGGMFCEHCDDLSITNNTISGNYGHRGGGMNCVRDSSVVVSNNIISGNSSFNSGGGMRFQNIKDGLIAQNLVSGNWTLSPPGGNGAGIYTRNCGRDVVVSGNVVTENVAAGRGGAFFCRDTRTTLINNSATGNSAAYGGGICCRDYAHPILINTILWQDSSDTGPEICLLSQASDPCSLTVTYCDVQGGESGVFIDDDCVLRWEEGNTDLDPRFRDTEAVDLHLMADYCGDPDNSPCIDSGDPETADSLLDCSLGLGTLSCDIGAYGGNNAGWWTDVREDPNNGRPLPAQFLLKQNYPNPFNASTTIYYQVPVHGRVTLEVYNLLGQKVTTLLDGKQQAGCGSVLWDGSGVSSGVYFYRLTAEGLSETKRMLLLK
jgi:predicted outer membrane repeat protein